MRLPLTNLCHPVPQKSSGEATAISPRKLVQSEIKHYIVRLPDKLSLEASVWFARLVILEVSESVPVEFIFVM